MEVKRKKGHLVFPRGIKIKHPLATTYYSRYRIRDNPNVVCQVAEDMPEVRHHIDYEFYKKWKKALSLSENLKAAEDIDLSYDYGEYPPYEHQEKLLSFVSLLPAACGFAETGTGKTYVGCHLIRRRMQKGLVDNALIIAPKAVVEDGWPSEIDKFTPDLNWSIAHNTIGEYGKDLSEMIHASEVTITTPGTFTAHRKKFKNRGFDQIIIDESDMIGTSSKRAEALRDTQNWIRYRTLFTGTPGSLEKLYYQLFYVGCDLPSTVTKFRGKYCFSPPGHPYINKPIEGSRKKVANKGKDFCCYISKDVLDLPEQDENLVYIQPTDDIRKHYKDVVNDYYTRIEEEDLTIQTRLENLIKCQQVINGHVLIDEETKQIEKRPPKIEKTRQIVDEADEDVIIWAKFKQDFRNLKKEFGEDIPTVNGETTSIKDELDRFRDEDYKVLLAHPLSIQYGITLNNADTMVFYSYGWSIIEKKQTAARNRRIGQENKTYIYRLHSGGIERRIVKALSDKEEYNDVILSEIGDITL